MADISALKRIATKTPNLDAVTPINRVATEWRALALLNYYRLFVGVTALASFLFVRPIVPFGASQPAFFVFVAFVYIAFGFISHQQIKAQEARFQTLVIIDTVADIVAIAAMTHASGGAHSGLAVLLAVPVAGAGILAEGRGALALAAAATLTLLIEHSLSVLSGSANTSLFAQVGMLGATFFATAILASALAKRARESELLAEQRGIDLANLSQLNELIIQRMVAGVVVVDERNIIRLMNEAAWQLLGMPTKKTHQSLNELSPSLAAEITQWRADDDLEIKPVRIGGTTEIFPRFTALGRKDRSGTLILLEDRSAMNEQAQHMKITALGRLSASIAHEIRNPLGAISHAAQLLEESPSLNKADRRLTQIIREQSSRMNTLIENVMQLSRRERARRQEFNLTNWVKDFVEEFARVHGTEPDQIKTHIDPGHTKVLMDASHLHQIVSNLCENALKHGVAENNKPKLLLRGGSNRESRGPFLEVIDFGPGVPSDLVAHIFEPFFTTQAKGTGLGLFIARELCEANQAHLDYVTTPAGGSCFRVTFAATQKRTQDA